MAATMGGNIEGIPSKCYAAVTSSHEQGICRNVKSECLKWSCALLLARQEGWPLLRWWLSRVCGCVICHADGRTYQILRGRQAGSSVVKHCRRRRRLRQRERKSRTSDAQASRYLVQNCYTRQSSSQFCVHRRPGRECSYISVSFFFLLCIRPNSAAHCLA